MKRQLDIIQVFRGLAAVLIVFHHIIPSLGYFQNQNYAALDYLRDIGKYGVDFFFVISGFIITYSNSFKKDNDIARYLKNRAVRIYIPYLPVGVAMLILYNVFSNLSEVNREISWLTSITLFPFGNPALAVAWTLTFEMLFYVTFIIYLVNRKLWNVFVVIWIILIIFVNVSDLNISNSFFNVFTSYYNLEFIMGYFLCVLILKRNYVSKTYIYFLLPVSICIFLYFRFFNILPFNFLPNLCFAFFSLVLIYYFLSFKVVKLSATNIFMIIGNATYSIYLVHGPLHAIIERYLPITSNIFIYLFYILVVSVICLFAGYVYYLIFEKKIMTVIKGMINNYIR